MEKVYIFSLLYPGAHYLLFELCEKVGIYDPQTKALLARLAHGLFSMLSIYYGYLLTLRLTNRSDTAKIVGLFMAIFWLFPFMSVRNLREFVCVPFLLMGSYYAADSKPSLKSVLWSAWWFAWAFDMRLQSIFVPFGVGLSWLLVASHRSKAIVFGLAFVGFVFVTQGLFDYLYYGDPLASTLAYANYNATYYAGFPNGPWYQYFGTVAGLLLGLSAIPLIGGYVRTAQYTFPTKVVFWSSLLFFAFHSYFPNKQERFILPFMPYILLLGVIGFQDFYEKNEWKPWVRKATKVLLVWLLVLNTVALFVLTFTYSKRARVEAMRYLREKGDVTNLIMDGDGPAPPPPLFYLQKFVDYYELNSEKNAENLKKEMAAGTKPQPNYVIMAGDDNADERLKQLKTLFPTLRHKVDIEPGLVDNIAFKLNPKHNQNEVWRIYKIK